MTPNALINTLSSAYDVLKPHQIRLLTPIAEANDRHNHEVLLPLAHYVFACDLPSKGMRRALISLLFDFPTPDLTALLLIRALSAQDKSTAVNPDAIIQYVSQQAAPLATEPLSTFTHQDVPLLLKHMTHARLLKLIWTSAIDTLHDTVRMMRTIDAHMPALRYLPTKPKSITQLHACCVRMMPKIGQEDFDLAQREDILQLDGQAINDTMTVRVPKTHFDLIDLGESLSFCIGNGDYSRMVQQKQCSIVAICDNTGPLFGVQFNRYRLLQAQGFANEDDFTPSKAILTQLQGVLFATPSFVNDFLPIHDSRWVHGYRYTDKDLYLLLNDWVYLYADVPQDVYEALLESDRKGQYVNQHIKPCYSCERIGHIDDLALHAKAA